MTITVAIKALNEEAKIAAAIESALVEVAPFGGNVVVADSISSDRTIEIARQYDIRIVQLAEPADRGCGSGAQLAYQGVETPYFYLMDGDMKLSPGFLAQALQWLEEHPECAGVGGAVVETAIANEEFEIRNAAMSREHHRRSGLVDRLDGGGLYRTEAIRSVGYFADRNLPSYEEFEVGVRLRAKGWTLARIPVPAVTHQGHVTGGYRLMAYRWRSGQLGGVGQAARACLGGMHDIGALSGLSQLRVILVTMAWWMVVLASAFVALPMFAAALLVPLAFLVVRRRSLRLGLYSFVSWNAIAVATLFGFAKPRIAPEAGVQMVEVSRISGFGGKRPVAAFANASGDSG